MKKIPKRLKNTKVVLKDAKGVLVGVLNCLEVLYRIFKLFKGFLPSPKSKSLSILNSYEDYK